MITAFFSLLKLHKQTNEEGRRKDEHGGATSNKVINRNDF